MLCNIVNVMLLLLLINVMHSYWVKLLIYLEKCQIVSRENCMDIRYMYITLSISFSLMLITSIDLSVT